MQHQTILSWISKSIRLSEPDQSKIQEAFEPLAAEKSDHLIQAGEVAEHLYFVNQGFLRCYTLDAEGNELTTHLVGPGYLVTTFDSYMHATPSPESLQCLSHCQLLRISHAQYRRLFEEIPGWSTFCNGVYERYIQQSNGRLLSMQQLSATERYEQFLQQHPQVALHTPIKHLASYLGIQPQSLSRIRSQIS